MTDKNVNSISGRLSLRPPQRESLEILSRVTEIIKLDKSEDLGRTLDIIKSEYPSVTDFERDFPSLCFALATGVGKTRLMGAFISYLHAAHGINNYFVLAPNLTIYNKLIADFTPNTPKYVFKGISELSIEPPLVITGDNYESGIGIRKRGTIFDTGININIFNISKINTEVRGGKAPRIKRLSEYIGESYFDYLAALPDLVLIMDESHRYRASAGIRAINELKPIIGLELTATPFTEGSGSTVPFKNVIYDYPLSKAMEDGFVKEPAVVTQVNFNPSQFTPEQLEKIKLEDGVRLHESTKVELETYARQADQPTVKPFVLVIARDTTHANELQRLMESEAFFEGRYKGKVIQVHSNQSGEEKEEFVERLLAVEKSEEPTEIVIHVNMLKEGWDVTNLYTIVPLRAANARTLVEQSIGRGLRLPYGKRTGVSAVDRLNIVAHDRFQEIVDEANRADSPIRLKTILLDPTNDFQKTRTVVSEPYLVTRIAGEAAPIGATPSALAEGTAGSVPAFSTEADKAVAQTVLKIVQRYEHLPSSGSLLKEDVQKEIAEQAQAIYVAKQMPLPGFEQAIDYKEIVSKVTMMVVQQTIDIPRILVVPKGEQAIGYRSFDLDCSIVNFQPVERDLLFQYLRTHNQETMSFSNAGRNEERLEDYIVKGLIDFEDISYDDHADLLYHMASQLVTHFKGYLKSEEDVGNVILYHQRQLCGFIHAQMLEHQFEEASEYEVVVSKGFTELKATAFTALDGADHVDFRTSDYERGKIGKLVFGGFTKCLYPYAKFDSDTERRFAVILERDSQKWFRPVKGQFQIFYRIGNDHAEYIPDFVAETADKIYMVETKAQNEMESPEVLAKKEAAVKWCTLATAHNREHGGKEWKYLLIPHDEVRDNMTLEYFGSR